jgi:hypothetical protein
MPVFAGLDFSDNHADDGFDIYQASLEVQSVLKPRGILAGTWNLGPTEWMKGNVLGRLVALAMGAANVQFDKNINNSNELGFFQSAYQSACRSLLFGESALLCDLEGRVTMFPAEYRSYFAKQKHQWRHDMCDKLTHEEKVKEFQVSSPHRRGATSSGNQYFFDTLGTPLRKNTNDPEKPAASSRSESLPVIVPESIQRLLHANKGNAAISKPIKKGIILDLVNSVAYPNRIEYLLKHYLAPLGCFDTVQLRIADDYGFALGMEVQQKIGYSVRGERLHNSMPQVSNFSSVVRTAQELGIDIIPEITVTTNAGGWAKAGYLRQCPNVLCQTGKGVANDIKDAQFLPVVYSVLREMLEVFSTSTYIHLGSDEREESKACYKESGHVGDLPNGRFERKLKKLTEMLGIKPGRILRWENCEHIRYPDRTGEITHYRSSVDHHYALPDIRRDEPFVVTLDILEEENIYAIYFRSRELVQLSPNGIMGEVRLIGEGDMVNRNIGIRLIAFAAGISSGGGTTLLSPEDLSKKVADICHAANFNDGCDCKAAVLSLSSHTLDKPDEPIQYGVESASFREMMCYSLTYERKARLMRDDFASNSFNTSGLSQLN